jgi:hypothetical protein
MSSHRDNSATRVVLAAAVCALMLSTGAARAEKKDENANIRTVQGVVRNPQDEAVNGAVVQLKNTKTLQIRSFITRDNGTFYFHGLSTDVDYELRADELIRLAQDGRGEFEAGAEEVGRGDTGTPGHGEGLAARMGHDLHR